MGQIEAWRDPGMRTSQASLGEERAYDESMSQMLSINFAQPVPLFPLPTCVLLPHATVPLHIFEPRYRAMVNDAVDGRGLIAMATFEGADWKRDYEGRPALRPHVCVGYMVRHDRLPDGRFNILLQGICRARIVSETRSDPYRAAVLEPTEPRDVLEIDLAEPRQKIGDLLADPLLAQLASVSAISRWCTQDLPTAALIDLAAMALCEDVERRYALLAESDPQRRAQWVQEQLSQTRRTLEIAQRYMPADLPDHMSLN